MSDDAKVPFRPSSTQVIAGVVIVLLVAFALANSDSVQVHFLVTSISAPLWLVLVAVIILAFGAGFVIGGRRGKRR